MDGLRSQDLSSESAVRCRPCDLVLAECFESAIVPGDVFAALVGDGGDGRRLIDRAAALAECGVR